MSQSLVRLSDYIAYLKAKGLVHISTESSHQKWDYPNKPLMRPVTVDMNHDEVPFVHQMTNARSLGTTASAVRSEMRRMGIGASTSKKQQKSRKGGKK